MHAYKPVNAVAIQALEIVLSRAVLFKDVRINEGNTGPSAESPHRIILGLDLGKTSSGDKSIDLIPVILAFPAVAVRLLVVGVHDFHADAVFHNQTPFVRNFIVLNC